MIAPLSTFAGKAASWSLDDREALVRWVGEPANAGPGPTSTISKRGDPVFRTVMAPTLREWRALDPMTLSRCCSLACGTSAGAPS